VYRSQSITISEVVFDPFSSPYQKKPPEMATDDANSEKNSTGPGDLMGRPLKAAVWDLKVQMLENALHQAKFNQKKAARILGLTYHQFRGLYRQYRNGMSNE
jgi:psp operon transcriptional activator